MMKHEIRTVYIDSETCRTPTDEGFRGEVRQCTCGRIWLYDRSISRSGMSRHLWWQEMTANKRWIRHIRKQIKKKYPESLCGGTVNE